MFPSHLVAFLPLLLNHNRSHCKVDAGRRRSRVTAAAGAIQLAFRMHDDLSASYAGLISDALRASTFNRQLGKASVTIIIFDPICVMPGPSRLTITPVTRELNRMSNLRFYTKDFRLKAFLLDFKMDQNYKMVTLLCDFSVRL